MNLSTTRQIHVDLPTVTFEIPADAGLLTVPRSHAPLSDPAAAIDLSAFGCAKRPMGSGNVVQRAG